MEQEVQFGFELNYTRQYMSIEVNQQLIIPSVKVSFQDRIQAFRQEDSGKSNNLWSYQQLKKSILQRYKYNATCKDKIHLVLLNFYDKTEVEIPIFHHHNFTYLIMDMMQRNINEIVMKVNSEGQLKKKKQREKNTSLGIQWDSDGQIQYCDENIKQAIDKNKPAMKAYERNSQAVRCFFCHKSSKDLEQIKSCGPFYGPFLKKYYGHLLCLLWCSNVYLNDKFEFCGISKAINDSKSLKCSYCQQKGASFNCHNNKCDNKGHYKCAVLNKWNYQWQSYQTYCQTCAQINDSQAPTITISQKHAIDEQKECNEQIPIQMQQQT